MQGDPRMSPLTDDLEDEDEFELYMARATMSDEEWAELPGVDPELTQEQAMEWLES